ncbi:NADPH-dependent FMN reductase [Tenacibaculum geojense]|uniref:NADPH-dependent FMN reductase n=1 Tax=Tenacibaculum geojense TaxID=915352 RepID=A0ABW3JRA9_9FLAO
MKKVAVFAGSNSKQSINKALATYAAQSLKNSSFTVLDLNDYELPLYGVDYETENPYPENADKFNNQLDNFDGFIISLAEHNGTYTAVFKNLLDWLSRKERKIFRDKPTLLLSTSPGPKGAQSVLSFATNSFPFFGAKITDSFSLPSFNDIFKKGEIIEKNINDILSSAVENFENQL